MYANRIFNYFVYQSEKLLGAFWVVSSVEFTRVNSKIAYNSYNIERLLNMLR